MMLKVPRFRLSLRDLFAVVLIVSIGLAAGTYSFSRPDSYPEYMPPLRVPPGLIEGVLIAGGLTFLYLAVRRGPSWKVRAGSIFFAMPLLWFGTVDASIETHWCGRCGEHYWTDNLRLCHHDLAIGRSHDHRTLESRCASYLGVPCQHQYRRDQWTRVWGLALPYPRGGCTCCLSGGEETDTLRRAVERLAREDPGLPQEYRRRVLEERDEAYLTAFRARLRAELARGGD
jgi:hypothetical protein